MQRNIIYPTQSIKKHLLAAHPGDLLAVDLIGTLVHVSHNQQERMVPVEDELLQEMARAVGRGIDIVIMVSYPEERRSKIAEDIKRARLAATHLICAPAKIVEAQQISTYSDALLDYVEKNNKKYKRIYVVDEQHSNLAIFRDDAEKFPAPLLLYHFSTPAFIDTLININTNVIFPPDLRDFHVFSKLGGTTECVYVIEHHQSRKRFALKLGTSEEALAAEMLTKIAYRTLDIPTLCMRFYHLLPASLAEELGLKAVGRLVQVSTLLDQSQPKDIAQIKNEIPKHFVAHALLGNNDAGNDFNHLIDREQSTVPQVVIMDGGANFLFRYNGERRPTPAAYLYQLRAYSEDVRSRAKFTCGLSAEDVYEQAIDILRRQHVLMNAVRDAASKLPRMSKIGNEFVCGLANRLDALATEYLAVPQSTVKADKAALREIRSAGVLVIVREKGELQVLLTRQKKLNQWGFIDGDCHAEDVSLLGTAIRITKKNTDGCVAFSREQLSNAPFHDFLYTHNMQPFLSRMYIALHPPSVKMHSLPDNVLGRRVHLYINLSDLMSAVHQGAVDQRAAVYLNDVREGRIMVSPLLVNMLRELPVSECIGTLLRTQSLSVTRTLGYHSNFIPSLTVNFRNHGVAGNFKAVVGNDHLPLQLAKQGLRKHGFLREMKQRFPQILSEPESFELRYLPSEQYLMVKYGSVKNFAKQGFGVNLHRHAIDNFLIADRSEQQSARLAEIHHDFCQAEDKMRPDEYCLYIYTDAVERFTIDLLTAIESLLKGEAWPVLRGNHSLFHKLGHISQLLAHFSNEGTGDIDVCHPDYKACVLTAYTNVYAMCRGMGQLHSPPSHSSKSDMREVIARSVQTLNPRTEHIEEAISIYRQFEWECGDAPHQLIINKEFLSEYAYLSDASGQVMTWQGSHDVTTLLDAVSKSHELPNDLANCFIQSEVRVMATRQLRMKMKTIEFEPFTNVKRVAYHTALDDLARKLVFEFYEMFSPALSLRGGPLMRSSIQQVYVANGVVDFSGLYAYQLYLAIKLQNEQAAHVIYEACPDALLMKLAPHHFKRDQPSSMPIKNMTVLGHVLELRNRHMMRLIIKMIGSTWSNVLARGFSFPNDYSVLYQYSLLNDDELCELAVEYVVLNPTQFFWFNEGCSSMLEKAVCRQLAANRECKIRVCQLAESFSGSEREEFILANIDNIKSVDEVCEILKRRYVVGESAYHLLREQLRYPQRKEQFMAKLIEYVPINYFDAILEEFGEVTINPMSMFFLRGALSDKSYEKLFVHSHTQFKTWKDFIVLSPIGYNRNQLERLCALCMDHIGNHLLTIENLVDITSRFSPPDQERFVRKFHDHIQHITLHFPCLAKN